MFAVFDIAGKLFAGDSFTDRVLQLAIIIGTAALMLFVFDRIVERVTPLLVKKVDEKTTSENVMRLRRAETYTGLAITIFRILVVLATVVAIWQLFSPRSGPLALIGVGTLGIVLGGATNAPLLKDMT
jgi:mannose/fructose/N-acetylgalactosamine-specific phosphotransferase system component IIC